MSQQVTAPNSTPMPPHSDFSSANPDGAIRCFACPCGCVCLRWHGTLLLHFDAHQLACAVNCLEEVLRQPSCAFSLGEGTFCACRAADGHYYLACQERIVLRLSEDDARELHFELASARSQVNAPRPILHLA